MLPALGAASLLLGPLAAQADPAQTTVHVVQSGETLSQIALDIGADVDAIAALNGLADPNLLSIGQSLKLPPGSSGSPPSSGTAGASARSSASPATYTVVGGDTLWAIAQQFSTTTDTLVQLNQLEDPNRLSLGQILSLPASAASGSAYARSSPSVATPKPPDGGAAQPVAAQVSSSPGPRHSLLVSYTVQAGETLNQIARQFGVRGDTIAQSSGLDDPNKLAVGAVLKVPVAAKEHVVSAGETLRDIAATEKVDLGSLIDFNQIDDPALIHIGQVVLLPVAATTVAEPGGTIAGPLAPASAQTAAAAPASPSNDPSRAAAAATAPVPTNANQAAASPANSAPTAKPASGSPKSAASPPATKSAAAAPATTAKPAAPIAVVAPPPGSPTDGVAGAALKFLGTPYVWGGSSPSGFDCSGFVWYVARQVGKQLSRGMFGQYNGGSHPAREDLKVGDLVFFQNTFAPGLSHNGIYIGNGQFVHAADEAAGVTVSSLSAAYWSSHWFGATRLP